MKKASKLLKYAVFALILTSCSSGGGNGGNGGNGGGDGGNTSDGYKCKVVDPSGNPVSGVMVQWCDDSRCYSPANTDENGEATADLDSGKTYSVHLSRLPSGYAYNPNIYFLNDSQKELTITLSSISTPASGEGTEANPYVLTTGVYSFALEQDETTGAVSGYYFTSESAYVIESWADTSAAAMISIDAVLYKGTTVADDDSGNGKNFAYTATDDYASTMTITGMADAYPATLVFSITNN